MSRVKRRGSRLLGSATSSTSSAGGSINAPLLEDLNEAYSNHHQHRSRFPSDFSSSTSSTAGTTSTHGLLITMDPNIDEGAVKLQFVADQHYPEIHPNAYAPAALSHMHRLGGGGSGVAVFEGRHPTMGDLVMKHGGDKDMKELFALATIAQELKLRAQLSEDCKIAAADLQARIPEFRMIYISTNHLGEKRRALWHRLRNLYKYSSRNLLLVEDDDLQSSVREIPDHHDVLEPVNEEDDEAADNSASNHAEPIKLDSSKDHENDYFHGSTSNLMEQDESYRRNHRDEEALSKKTWNHDPDDIALKRTTSRNRKLATVPRIPSKEGLTMTQSGTVTGHRDIAIFETEGQTSCSVELLGDSLTINLPPLPDNDAHQQQQQSTSISDDGVIVVPGGGYEALRSLVKDLLALMTDHKWKLTLGQKRIGGDHPKTGNLWLYEGKLLGTDIWDQRDRPVSKLLDNLISQQIHLVRNLTILTTPEEQDPQILVRVHKEIARFEEEGLDAGEISIEADSFAGNAIKKNYQHDTGRFPVLMRLGRQFREYYAQSSHLGNQFQYGSSASLSSNGSRSSNDMLVYAAVDENETALFLTPEEEIPAVHLGNITRPGGLFEDTFENSLTGNIPTPLDHLSPYFWRNLMRVAIKPRHHQFAQTKTPLALTRIWTCGLTDAGIHNLFLNEEYMWLFDLGSPQHYSAPGFLTKFLFSFFHTLGMEEVPESNGDAWVRRFVHNPSTGRLHMTGETQILLRNAFDAFGTTLDRIIEELFDGDDSLRWLLVQYVTLQVLSDASFCLQRWTIKGGGRTRDSNHQKGIEKWLWRALWDMFVAFSINQNEIWTKLGVEHPSLRESMNDFDGVSDLLKDVEAMARLQSLSKVEEEEEVDAKEE